MSENGKQIFAFALGQRVVILGGVQAVVTARHEIGGREPAYAVQFTYSDRFGPEGLLTVEKYDISESALLSLQPPEMITLAAAQDLVDRDRKTTVEHYLDQIASLTRRIERLQTKSNPRKRR